MNKSYSPILNSRSLEERIARSFLTLLLLALGVYSFMIGSITVSTISSKSMESDTHKTISELNNLELSYLKASESIDANYAYGHNFIDAKEMSFAKSNTSVAFNGKAQ